MRDQVGELKERGVKAVALHSAQTDGAKEMNMRAVQTGSVPLVYVSPERLADPAFRQAISRVPFSTLALDEAHCLSMWGHSFRPDYLAVRDFADSRPDLVRSAYTATASPMVQRDIVRDFGLRDPHTFVGDPIRPNLSYDVTRIDGHSLYARNKVKDAELLRILAENQDRKTLIYGSSIDGLEELHKRLRAQGIPAGIYHGDIDRAPRKAAEEAFKSGDVRVMVATNAFGMGVNVPDIRTIVHFDAPSTLTNYAQETGRSGRDGLDADCHLFYAPEDLKFRREVLGGEPDSDYIKRMRATLLLYHNGGAENAGKPFRINWGNFYKQMNVNSHRPSDKTRFNTSMKILKQYGLLTQEGELFTLTPVDPQGPELQNLVARLKIDHNVRTFGLQQMERYAAHQDPSQDLLFDLLNEDIKE